jgi:hypothetical protein
MHDVRTDVRARLRSEISRLDPASPLLEPEMFEEVEELLRTALARRRALMSPSLLLDEHEWDLATSLRFSSHRQRTGGLVLFVKRRVLLPLTRWLYEFSRDNFERQNHVNDTLMAAVETLTVEVLRLRREVESMRRTPPPAAPSPDPR